jgi:hypothetical protein
MDIGPGNLAFKGLKAAVSTAPATLWSSNLSFSMVALKLTLVQSLFMFGLGLI